MVLRPTLISAGMPRKYVPITALLDDFSLDEERGGLGAPKRADLAKGGTQTPRASRHRLKRPERRQLSSQQYINMTCRFVLKPGTVFPLPDEVVDFESVLRAVAAPTGCPICLETAVVPRMLSCGHIMCLPCFFRFLKYSEEHVCPVCGEPTPRAVTNVSFLPADPRFLPQLDHEVVLNLVSKPLSGFPRPVGEALSSEVEDQLRYSRLVYGTEAYCAKESTREIQELEDLMSENVEEGYFQALAACKADLASASKITKPPAPPAGKPSYFYYQTAFESPTTYVLSPLDITVLKACFGEYPDFPPLLIAKVDNIIHKTVDNDIRKRMKFLGHIPTDAPLVLLECDWRGVLPAEVVSKFGKQLSERRKRRKTRDRIDNKRRQKAEQESDSRMRAEVLVETSPPEPANINLTELPSLGARPAPPPRTAKWVDSQAEFDEMMANAYVTKRGRRKIVLSSNH